MKDYPILQSAFRKLYLAGVGNFWYEDDLIGDETRFFYQLCRVLMFATFVMMTVLEILAITIGNFPDDERGDATTFALSHSIVLLKILSVCLNKRTIRSLCRKLVTTCEQHEEDTKMARKYKMIKINVIAYMICVNMSLVSFVFEGCRKLYFDGEFDKVQFNVINIDGILKH